MYGFEHEFEPVTEGAFGDFFGKVWQTIQKVGKFLRDAIVSLGNKLKKDKASFAENDGKASTLIDEIGSKTTAFIKTCSSAINSMFAEYSTSAGKVRVEDENSDTTGRVVGNRASTKSALGVGEDDTVSFDPSRGHMQKASNVDSKGWNEFQSKWGKIFSDMHGDAEEIKKKLVELRSAPPLSYATTVKGYKRLKDLYDANGSFGKEWSQLKTAHAFANPTGKIKAALGKIVTMYNVGVNAAQAFGKRLLSGNFRQVSGEKFDKSEADIRGKSAYYGIENKEGKFEAAKKADKKSASRNEVAMVERNGAYEPKETKESALLSRLYDMAYEDARRDFEEQAQYVSAFESVPDAFASMEEEFVDDFVPDPMFE